ncbi:hypothetical protein GCK72_002519 [Caenorhabditis remanei]|uniref:Uncharacterized protein n=2 Tax=Caenorhabditis remanei TaxID=31234 RepID=E3LVM7_CAERE|nr:hypothetical protein GCK72_002519 [Caenorhabditis remanei]EFP12528.1 hypothetical protein CRE_29553 [Caenorhabditis remanei]KAF1770698.1 hypothetical protein GCK72_002519 [Caenorhabditis remanei]
MSLSLLTPRLVTKCTVARILVVRNSSSRLTLSHEQSIKINDQQGFFKYQRDVSRDARYSNPAKPGDTASRFMFRKLGHAYEIYPLFGLLAIWCVLFGYTVYYSFEKAEIWLDRSHTTAPWDWERIRNNYWKKPTLVFDPTGVTHQRLEIMETLQDEMVAAAKERGTR